MNVMHSEVKVDMVGLINVMGFTNVMMIDLVLGIVIESKRSEISDFMPVDVEDLEQA